MIEVVAGRRPVAPAMVEPRSVIAVAAVPAAAGGQAAGRRTTTVVAGVPVTVVRRATARCTTIAADARLLPAGHLVAGPRSTIATVGPQSPVAAAGELRERSPEPSGSMLVRLVRLVETCNDFASGSDLVEVDDDEVWESSGCRLTLEDPWFQDRGGVGSTGQ